MSESYQFTIDWHTVEKIVWGLGTTTLFAALTIARPWLARQIIKLLNEDKATYVDFMNGLWKKTFDRIDSAETQATEALRMAKQIKEDVEQLQSASEEQGLALSEIQSMPKRFERITRALEAITGEINDAKITMARLEERQKLRAAAS